MTPPHERVTIVTVSYNSMRVLPQMLESIPQGTPTVIVDNASDDLDALEKLARLHDARLITNHVNEGFGVACNKGAAIAKTEFLLFLNPDARLKSDTLTLLVRAAERYPKASAMNPRIEDNGGRPFFKRKSHLMRRSEWMARGWPGSDQEVSVLSGAAMFVKRIDFEAVGGFDPEIFLFHEDDDLALRLRRKRGPLMFIHDAVVQHGIGSSSERSAEVAALKAWHMGHSRVYGARKHGVAFAGTRAVIEASLNMISPLMLFSTRKRAKHWAFLRGVCHALVGGKSNARLGPR